MRNIKKVVSFFTVLTMILSMFAGLSAYAVSTELADGKYTVNVRAWHEINDSASMMAAALDSQAVLDVADGEITVTVKFIEANLMGMNINGSIVLEVWPEPASPPAAGTGIIGEFDSGDNSNTYSFVLSGLDMPKLSINVGAPMNSIQTIRLNFDLNTLAPEGGLQNSYTVNGKARVEQFGKYDVDVAVTVTDGIISGLVVTGSGYSGTYAEYNPIVLQRAVDGIKDQFIGLPINSAEAISGIDAVSSATYSSKAIIAAVMDALNLELEDEPVNVPETLPPAGVYEVDVAYYTDVVYHSLLKDDRGRALLTVTDDGSAVLTMDLISGTETEPLYLLEFNGYYDGGELKDDGVLTKTLTMEEYTVCGQVSFPLIGLSAAYSTNTYLYVPAMKNLNGEISGIMFDNGKFSVDSFVTVYWDTLTEKEPAIANGKYTVGVRAWHETNDAASMMAPLLDTTAVLEVESGEITATITFIDGTIMTQPVSASSITEVWPEFETKPTAEDRGTGVSGVTGMGSNAFTFPLSTLDMPKLAMDRGSISVVRLNFDMDSLERIWLADFSNPFLGEWQSYIPSAGLTLKFNYKTDGTFDYEMSGVPAELGGVGSGAYAVNGNRMVTYLDFEGAAMYEFEAAGNDVINVTELEVDEQFAVTRGNTAPFTRVPGSTVNRDDLPFALQNDINGTWRALIPAEEEGGEPADVLMQAASDGSCSFNYLDYGVTYSGSYFTIGDIIGFFAPDMNLVELFQMEKIDDNTYTYTEIAGINQDGTRVLGAAAEFNRMGDKTALTAMVDSVKDTTQGSYTTSSWNAFQTALTAAREVLADESATPERVAEALANLDTAIGNLSTGGGSSTGNGDSDKPSNGNYTIDITAIQASSSSLSMTNQFIKDSASLEVSGNSMTLTVKWTGTDAIHMDIITKLEYKNQSGNYVSVNGKNYNSAQDTYTFSLPVQNLNDEIYMRVTTSEGMTEPQIFRLKLDKASLKKAAVENTVNNGSGGSTGATPSPSPSPTPAAVPAPPSDTDTPKFTDTAGHWAQSFIESVVSKGIFNGTDVNAFSPDARMTRGMFVTVTGRMAGVDVSGYTSNIFTDVDSESYYAPYVAWARENGIVNGIGGGLFDPEAQITREQMAVMIYKSASFTGVDVSVFDRAESMDSYTVRASALKENSDDESMTNQFFTEPALITEKDGEYIVTAVLRGTDFITMDMLEELKIQQSDGSFADVEKVLDAEANTLTVTLTLDGLDNAVVMQTYVPAGMGEIRPNFRLVFDTETKQAVPAGDEKFADDAEISDWASESVYAMKNAGFISGKGGNVFDPQGTATRAEAAKILAMISGYGN
jgi:heme-binding NEAT domain protein/uncharacterized protein with FMN-binding domain